MQPLGVQGMKQLPSSPRDSFPAFILVKLGRKINQIIYSLMFSGGFVFLNIPCIKDIFLKIDIMQA